MQKLFGTAMTDRAYFSGVGLHRKLQGPCVEMARQGHGPDCHNGLCLAAYKMSARLARAAYTVSDSLASQGQKKLKRSLGSKLTTFIRAVTK